MPSPADRISRRGFARGVGLALGATAHAQTPETTEGEKAEIKRLAGLGKKASEAMRAFPLTNADEPATVFRIYRSDRK